MRSGIGVIAIVLGGCSSSPLGLGDDGGTLDMPVNDGAAASDATTDGPPPDLSNADSLKPFASPTFANAMQYSAGTTPTDVAISDVNGDGKLDVVAAVSTGFAALLGDGTGALGIPKNTAVGTLHSIVSFDANGDGNADVLEAATVSGGAAEVGYFTSNGDGSFTFATSYLSCSSNCPSPYALSLGDVNGDGRTDVLVHLTAAAGSTEATDVAALLSTSAGSFTVTSPSPASTAAGDDCGQMAIADFNGDHNADVIVTSRFNAWLMLGNGAGVFGAATMLASGTGSNLFYAAGTADFNADGKADVIVAGDQAVYRIGNGNGTLGAPMLSPSGGRVYKLAVGDVNGDGRPDVVAASADNHAITVLVMSPNGDFVSTSLPAPAPAPAPGTNPISVAIGDLNKDGKPDIVAADFNNILVYMNTTP